MEEADLIVLGRVVSSEPFYNAFGEIYTMHKLLVDQIAGETSSANPSAIQFFTMGGTINEEQTIVYPSLRDIFNAEGMFLLNEYTGNRVVSGEGNVIYRPTAVHESLLPYDENTGNFSDGEVAIGNLARVNALVEHFFGQGFHRISDREFVPRPTGRSMMPTVSSISPLSVNAGIGDEITISGSGFGSEPGNVFFDNPDDGPGRSYTAVGNDDILAWSSNSIRVRVISNAGSGSLLIQTAAGDQVNTTQEINIDFAVTNLNLSSGEVVTPLLIDDQADGNGGYSFAVSNSSANGGVSLADNAPALNSLQRAIATWQSQGDFSVYLEGTTGIQTPSRDDEVNIVAFGSNVYDFDRELGTGTVGIAFSYYNICGSSEFELTGADVLFRRNGNPNGSGGSVNYNYGPGLGGGTDFESVALHEFGHVHQLKHVSDPTEVMSYRITNGATQRNISADTRAGADYVSQLSVDYDPPIINCGGDFGAERDYVPFSEGGILPVVWEAFTALSLSKEVALNWRTSAERDIEFFEVQRSADGRDFFVIGTTAATNGAAAATYRFADDRPLGGTSYYRIAQRDYSGNLSYTDVREVTRAAATSLKAYPNPVVNTLMVEMPEQARNTLSIFDASGKEVGTWFTNGAPRLEINVAGFAPGHYVLRTKTGETLQFVR